MQITITDLARQTFYTASSEDECRGLDVHAFQMAALLGDVVVMGKTVADPSCSEVPNHFTRIRNARGA